MGRIIILGLLVVLFTGCKDDPETVLGNITGVVIDELSMDPISSADIEIEELNRSTVSATDGSFSFTDIPSGSYNLIINKFGYTESKRLVRVLNGQTSETSVSLSEIIEEADIIWKNWYLSVPIDNGDGKATSIFYQDIINDNLTTEEKKYFYFDDEDGSYVFWTEFTGFTTSGPYPLNGAAYCRTELREYWQGNQSTSDNWYMNEGETHIMESTLKVDHVGGNGRTFVGQIHGRSSTDPNVTNGPATVKVLWEDGDIEVEYYVKPPDPTGEWTSDYNAKSQRIKVDNEEFTIKLRVLDGVLSWAIVCEAKGINNDYVELFDYASNGYHYDNYFKTGNYFQWKSDYTESAQVRLYKVITHHE